jgi:LacI family transcriptional regulator
LATTIRDVADRAGVSKATVSYILNGRAAAMRIPEETRQRVLVAVLDLGYHPNALARGLAHKRTDTVAVVLQFPAVFSGWSGFTNEVMHGVTDAAIRLGYDVLLHTRQPQDTGRPGSRADPLAAEVATLTDGRVDGALLLRDIDDGLAGALHARRLPTVLMFTHADDAAIWYVDCDNVAGAILGTEHLIALGHRRIVHLAGSERSGAARDRQVGYRRAMADAGIDPAPDWIIEITYGGADFAPVLGLFDRPSESRPTAVFAWSDDVAITLMSLLRARGLRVPDDVAIVGFDSTQLCDHTDPPLSSVRQPIYDMADQAFEELVRRIANEASDRPHALVAPTLTVRRSCGAVNGGCATVRGHG